MNGAKTVRELRPEITPDTAKVQASDLIKRADVQNEIAILMNSAGITKDYLVEKVNEGLNAVVIKDKEMTTAPDYANRHKYLTTALKLHGELSEKEKNTPNQVNIGVVYIPRELPKGQKGDVIDL
jgi:hypothetical protein